MAFENEIPEVIIQGVKKIARHLTHNKMNQEDLEQEGLLSILQREEGNTNALYLRIAKEAMMRWLHKEQNKGMTYIPQERFKDGRYNTNKKKPVKFLSLDQMIEEERFINEGD